MALRFGRFELDAECHELRYDGTAVTIAPKPLSILVYLAERHDRMVPKTELLDAFWSASASEASLQKAISQIRRAVGCRGDAPVIKTYHGRGFRFVAPIADGPESANRAADTESSLREVRIVTVLSVHIAWGVDEAADHDRGYREVEAFLETARSRVEADSAELLRIMVDGFAAVFGFGPLSEDSARRAVGCAFDLKDGDAARNLSASGLSLTFGIDTGSVALPGDKGPEAQWSMPATLERDATALARSAAPGDVVIGAASREQLREELELRPLDHGYQVLAPPDQRAGIPARPLRKKTPLVGRSAELAFLRAHLADAEEGNGNAVILSGPAGIGKSRLVEEFLASLDAGVRHETLRCLPRLTDTPLAPIRQMCAGLFPAPPDGTIEDDVDAALFARLHDDNAPVEAALASLSVHAMHKRSSALVARMLDVLARDRGVVLVFEDIHWVDPVSRSYLASLVRTVDRSRLLLVLTTRPTDSAPIADALLRVSPLGRGDSLKLLEEIAEEGTIRPDDADALLSRAAGNPFFIEELALSARLGGDPASALPRTVQAVIEGRIAALAPRHRAVLFATAIVGPPADPEMIADLLESAVDSVRPDLDQLTVLGLLQKDLDRISFRHMLLHDTAYAMIDVTDRRRMHAKVAAALEGDADARPEIIAWHLQEAGETSRAVDFWAKAANTALYRSVPPAAISFATRGLALIGSLADSDAKQELGLQLALASALMMQRGYGADEVGQAYRRAHQLAAGTRSFKARVRSLLGLWVYSWVAGQLDESLAHGRELLALADQAGDPELQLQGHGGIGSVLMHKGEIDAAARHLDSGLECLSLCDAETITIQNAAVTCAAYAAWVAAIQGRKDDMQAHLERSDRLRRAIDNPFASAIHFALTACAALCAGDTAMCTALARNAVELGRAQRYPFWLGSGLVVSGWARGRHGDFDGALHSINEGIAVFEATNARVQIANWYGLKAETLLAAGHTDAARGAVQHALAVAERTGDRWFVPRVHDVAARLHDRMGDGDGARRHRAKLASLVERNHLATPFVTSMGRG